jgi:hypothetical protein
MPEEEPTQFTSPDRYRGAHGWQYRIPFSPVVHPNHGRIMVGIEPLIEGGIIRQLFVWFDHHDIPDLEQPIAIPTPQAGEGTSITTFNFRTSDVASFFAGVWRVALCREHPGGLMFLSYPPDDASALIVDTLSTSISVHYEIRTPAGSIPEVVLQ